MTRLNTKVFIMNAGYHVMHIKGMGYYIVGKPKHDHYFQSQVLIQFKFWFMIFGFKFVIMTHFNGSITSQCISGR